MRQLWNNVMRAMFGVMTTMALVACGGGDGTPASTTSPPASTTVSGTAAAGAPIIGSVTIKDSTAPTPQTKTVTIAADGKYTVDVGRMKAPFMVRADGYVGGNDYHLYSAGTQADVGGTINVTPLTDMIMDNIAGAVAKTYFDNGSFTGLTAAQLTAQSESLKAKLLPVLQALGVSGSIDLLRASFNTDHTGMDAALDVLRVTTNPATGVATVTNVINQQTMTCDPSTGTYTGIMDNTTGVATGATAIVQITDGFKRFSALFATSVPAPGSPALLAFFDAPTFLQSGQNLDAFLSKSMTDPSMVGMAFTNVTILSMNATQDQALVSFDLIMNGMVSNDGPRPWSMIKKNGVWLMQGDLRIAHVKINPEANNNTNSAGSQVSTGLNISIEDRGAKGITSAVISGKGLAGQVTLVPQIGFDWFTIQGAGYSQNMYSMNDAAIATIADTGEVYTVQLFIGTALQATYTEKLRKRPYLSTELTGASFPVVTGPSLAALMALTSPSATVTWTLPAGLISDWLQVRLDNGSNSATAEYGLKPTDHSKAISFGTLSFTPTSANIYIAAFDGFGRSIATNLSTF